MQSGWLMLNIQCEASWKAEQKRENQPSESHNLIWILVVVFKHVHLPETHAWCSVLWVQLKGFLPLVIKTKDRMLVSPCLLRYRETFPVSTFSEKLSLSMIIVAGGWMTVSSRFFAKPCKQDLQQPMLWLPVWIHKSATSCLTLTLRSEKFSSVLLTDFYKYIFQMSKKPNNNNNKKPNQTKPKIKWCKQTENLSVTSMVLLLLWGAFYIRKSTWWKELLSDQWWQLIWKTHLTRNVRHTFNSF